MSFRDKFKGLIAADKAEAAEALFDELDETLNGYSADIKKLKASIREKEGVKPEQLAELENENTQLRTQVADLTKSVKKFEGEAKSATEKLTAEQARIQNLEVDRALTEQLTKAKVKPEHMPYVKAGLREKLAMEADGDAFKVVAKFKDKDGKDVAASLSDFIEKTWATGDGKAFIPADGNGGGGGRDPGRAGGSGKTATRAQVQAMNPADQLAFARDGGVVTD